MPPLAATLRMRELSRRAQQYQRQFYAAVAQGRAARQAAAGREAQFREALELAQEAKAAQDRTISELQTLLSRTQVELAQYKDQFMPEAERECRLQLRENNALGRQVRDLEEQVQQLQQAMAALTTERDEAQTQLWKSTMDLEQELLLRQDYIQALQMQIQDLQALMAQAPPAEEEPEEEEPEEAEPEEEEHEELGPGEDLEEDFGWEDAQEIDDWIAEPGYDVIDVDSDAPAPEEDVD